MATLNKLFNTMIDAINENTDSVRQFPYEYAELGHIHNEYADSNHTHSDYASATHYHNNYYKSGDSPIFNGIQIDGDIEAYGDINVNGKVYCQNVGTSSQYPTMIYCNNIAVKTPTTISNNNAGFNTTYGYIQQYSGSSEKFKHDIHSMSDEMKSKIEGLYDIEVKSWTYNEDYLDSEDELYGVETFGLIAEDLNEVLPEAITHNPDGSISNYRDRNLLNAMLYLLQQQKKEIDELKAKLEG